MGYPDRIDLGVQLLRRDVRQTGRSLRGPVHDKEARVPGQDLEKLELDVPRHVAARLRAISQGGQLVAVIRQGRPEQELGVSRRNARKTGDPCRGHFLQDGGRVREPIVDHQPPAGGHMGIEQRHAHDVEEREDGHLDIAGREIQVFNDRTGVGDDIGMRKHDAFRPPGGTGRVNDRRAGSRVDRQPEILIGMSFQFLEQGSRSAVPAGGSGARAHSEKTGEAIAGRIEPPHDLLRLRGTDEHLRPELPQQSVQSVRHDVRAERDGDGPRLENAKVANHVLDAVLAEKDDAVAGANAIIDQETREPVGAPVDLGIIRAPRAMDDGDILGKAPGAVFDKMMDQNRPQHPVPSFVKRTPLADASER